MREILFRGKRTDNGEWVEGAFSPKNSDSLFGPTIDKPSIIKFGAPLNGFWFDVDPETVGQYTGLTDKNGKKIFEGDIVHVRDCLQRSDSPLHEFDGKVEHRNASFVIVSDIIAHYRWLNYECEIIGNIHDNPELLEE